jgi:hypothetical protein
MNSPRQPDARRFGQVNANEHCVGSTCVTPAQFQAKAAAAGQSNDDANGDSGGSSPASHSGSSETEPSDSPSVMQINGDNPAVIQVGATYTDLGAQITGPQQDLNLGIETYLNGTAMSPIQLDTLKSRPIQSPTSSPTKRMVSPAHPPTP